MKRRDFIHVMMGLSFGGIYLALPDSVIAATDLENHWMAILDLARWCPSVHNLQPHRVKIINARELDIFYDPSHLLPYGDRQSIFATVAMGIFIEHISIASGSYGLSAEISKIHGAIDHQQKEITPFARIKLVRKKVPENLGVELILKRRTARTHYNGKPPDPELLQKLQEESASQGLEFASSTDKTLLDLILQQNENTLFEDLHAVEMRNELDHLFRYSKKEAREHQDGLWSRCMGFPGALMKSLFRHFDTWDRKMLKNTISRLYRNSFNGTTTIGWVTGKFDNTNDYLHFGRLMARNWLLITKYNAYIQPFGSLLTNQIAYNALSEKLNIPNGKTICMIFRIGYSKTPVRSYRLPLHQLILP